MLPREHAIKSSNKKIGSGFEASFDKCLSIKGFTVTRIPDGCKRVGLGKLIPVKAPFDFLVTGKGIALFTDTKTTIGDRFTYSAINQDQVSELLRIEKNGHISGYVIEFRQVDKVCFASASRLAAINPGESLKAWECTDLGKEISIEKLFEVKHGNAL